MRLAFYQGISFTSRIIKFQSRGIYSHVGILYDDGSIIEAWQYGGVLHNANIGTKHEVGTKVDVFDIDTTMEPYERDRVNAFLVQQLGKKYDYRGVFQFLPLNRMLVRNVTDDKTHWFCSDLVYMAFHMGGYDLLMRAPRGNLSPVELSYSPRLIYTETLTTV